MAASIFFLLFALIYSAHCHLLLPGLTSGPCSCGSISPYSAVGLGDASGIVPTSTTACETVSNAVGIAALPISAGSVCEPAPSAVYEVSSLGLPLPATGSATVVESVPNYLGYSYGGLPYGLSPLNVPVPATSTVCESVSNNLGYGYGGVPIGLSSRGLQLPVGSAPVRESVPSIVDQLLGLGLGISNPLAMSSLQRPGYPLLNNLPIIDPSISMYRMISQL